MSCARPADLYSPLLDDLDAAPERDAAGDPSGGLLGLRTVSALSASTAPFQTARTMAYSAWARGGRVAREVTLPRSVPERAVKPE